MNGNVAVRQFPLKVVALPSNRPPDVKGFGILERELHKFVRRLGCPQIALASQTAYDGQAKALAIMRKGLA